MVDGEWWRGRGALRNPLSEGFCVGAGAFKSVDSSKALSGIEGQRRDKLIALAGERPALQDLIVGRCAEATLYRPPAILFLLIYGTDG